MLAKIVQQTRKAVAAAKIGRPIAGLGEIMPGCFAFSSAVSRKDWTLIAECKLASPAKGRLCSRYTVIELAQIYASQGAAALSVHTNAAFCGSMDDIMRVKANVELPVLCKEFIIDEYQLYAARAAGADAVLLIAAILSDGELVRFLQIARKLGMDCLVEVHTLAELKRVQQTDAGVIGINNRDLQTFTTDIEQTFRLLPYCEPGRLIISESGIKDGHDAEKLKSAGVNGILVGESLVTADNIAAKTWELALIGSKQEGRGYDA
ncbi:indole-3-glycerol phosphate synthase TrpC [Sporomusa acidovorans]|uniref:indole-3-glycerol-phosphate synthase n=1 Tax=Sporomusa acidovorans (strain ATCC 49682 / DSM 3132 / Mol) TaxID=1123286 RepID=A0ABZ3J5B3_SPOA4|nr:indole-3-glycerol phosphate synthase TrpC [Sporomusa acidovorans]OZC15496.1 indole-3-glycerol phosphate synthase [Sporomusa acidovorans DSM 3132]SDE16171.1 indole-3-glycerol phosphate synthase [Sporomusa acidovorans]